MKSKIFILILLLSGLTLAQEKSLFDANISSVKGFGAVVTKYASLTDYNALIVGGRGGWIFNNTFIVGAGMYGLASNVPIDVVYTDPQISGKDRLHFMYGGVEVEYVFEPEEIVTYSVYTLIGLGTVSSHFYNQEYPDNYFDHNYMGNPFFVVEPSFNVKLNVTRFLQVSVGVSYLSTVGAEFQTVDDKSLSGVNGSLTIKFQGAN